MGATVSARAGAWIATAIGAALLCAIFVSSTRGAPAAPLKLPLNEPCEDWIAEVGRQDTCPHPLHHLRFERGGYRSDDGFMLCTCPLRVESAEKTPQQAWLHPGQRLRVRCAVANQQINKRYGDLDDELLWCADE